MAGTKYTRQYWDGLDGFYNLFRLQIKYKLILILFVNVIHRAGLYSMSLCWFITRNYISMLVILSLNFTNNYNHNFEQFSSFFSWVAACSTIFHLHLTREKRHKCLQGCVRKNIWHKNCPDQTCGATWWSCVSKLQEHTCSCKLHLNNVLHIQLDSSTDIVVTMF